MVVDLTLYLKALHWSGAAIGAVTTGAGLFGALLILFVGVVSDRVGRRPFLLVYEGLTMLAALLAAWTTAGVVLVLAIVVAGFGRGQAGGAGPFMPAEQAWLASHVSQRHRGRVFSINNAGGFVGMAVGSVLAGWPALSHAQTVLGLYRPVFLLVMAISLTCCLLVLFTPEEREVSSGAQRRSAENRSSENVAVSSKALHGAESNSAQQVGDTKRSADAEAPRLRAGANTMSPASQAIMQQQMEIEQVTRRRENRAMVQLALVNAVNGLAVGLTGPMMVYWFSLRFGASSADIGATLSVGFLLTGFVSFLSAWLADKYGMVRSVTGMRVVGSSMMLLLPFIPNFWGASGLYALRSAMNRGTQGNRSALSASIVRDNRRGLSISINALSMRLPSAIGPTITGLLFDAGAINLPIYLTAALQLVNAWLYQRMFGKYDQDAASGHK